MPVGFVLNDVQYYYVTDLSGNVKGITDANGELVASYEYDEWGKLLALTPAEDGNEEQIAVATKNPLRYRGYYYDNETGLYYLQSRYYDSDICRFINADIHEIVNVTKDVNVGINLFAYCNNNPINSRDINGHFYLLTVAGVSISAVSVAIIVAVFSFAILYAISPTFRSAVDDVVYMLANKAITAVKSFAATISAIVKVAKNSRKYNSNEVHHIVAKGDRRAKDSRNILNQCGISVNDRCNLVSIRKTLHKHIHTNEYHKKNIFRIAWR